MTPKIGDILDRRHVIPGLEARDKDSLIQELAKRAAVALRMDEAAIESAILAREKLGSTGVGGGVAIPHARLQGLAAPFGMFARIEPAIDYAAIDGRRVDLVFLLLTSAEGSADHLSLLAAISRRLRDRVAVTGIRNATNAKEIYSWLTPEAS